MLHNDVHAAIARHFHISNRQRRHGLPWTSSQRYPREILGDIYADLAWTRGAEIGVRGGAHALAMCQRVPGLHLMLVDPWRADYKYPVDRQETFMQLAIQRLIAYSTTMLRMTSLEALNHLNDGWLDFVYIDGDHRFDTVMQDIIGWSRKVKHGGIVACHDYHCGESGVTLAVEAYVRAHHIDPWYSTKEVESTAYWVNP